MSALLQEINRVIDHKTGEVLTTEDTQRIYFPKEPAYVKLYIEDIGLITGVPKASTDVLYHLIKMMGYDGIIRITKGTKDRLNEKHGIKDSTVRQALVKLCNKNILERISTGEYEVNPRFFAKGDWKDIRKRQNDFEMKIKYTKNGREITGKAV